MLLELFGREGEPSAGAGVGEFMPHDVEEGFFGSVPHIDGHYPEAVTDIQLSKGASIGLIADGELDHIEGSVLGKGLDEHCILIRS
jgi:hypothetical protein